MAKRRLLRFFVTLAVLFVVVGVLAVAGAWIVVSRGPSVPDHSTLILRIGGELVETPPNDVLGQLTGGARAQTVRGYVEALRHAKSDPRIDSVLIIPTPLQSPYWGKVQEIRDAVLDFRKSGKRIAAFLDLRVSEAAWPALLEYCSFDWMKHNATRSVPLGGAFWDAGAQVFIHKGVNGRWRDVLTALEAREYEERAVRELGAECAAWLATGKEPPR